MREELSCDIIEQIYLKRGLPEMICEIHWLGHNTFKIEGEKVIYTDPFQVTKEDTADIILIFNPAIQINARC